MLAQIARASVAQLPDFAAFQLTRALASRPPRLVLKMRDQEALSTARKLMFGWRSRKPAWSWGQGPVVICLHGWAGRGSQLASVAQFLAAQGFEAWVFDVTRHGGAQGAVVGFNDFIEDLLELIRIIDRPIHAIVGHSAAGMAMMAARRRYDLAIPNYVNLCAPYYPYVPVETIRRRLNPAPGVLARCEDYYAKQFGVPWEQLRRGWLYQEVKAQRMLLIYDHQDDQVRHSDAELIQGHWPGAQVMKTAELGHHKVLWDQTVKEAIAQFLLS